jgi:hypothetical protein
LSCVDLTALPLKHTDVCEIIMNICMLRA